MIKAIYRAVIFAAVIYAILAPFAFMERGYFDVGGEVLAAFAGGFAVLYVLVNRKGKEEK